MRSALFFVLVALASAQSGGKQSFTVESPRIAWAPIQPPGAPPGLEQKLLHDNKAKGLTSAIIRFPKGYVEPRHYHTKSGHSIYVLKGRIKTPDGVWTAGSFNYAAVTEPHGPFIALEETEILFYTDGPFDYHIAK